MCNTISTSHRVRSKYALWSGGEAPSPYITPRRKKPIHDMGFSLRPSGGVEFCYFNSPSLPPPFVVFCCAERGAGEFFSATTKIFPLFGAFV